MPRTHLCLLVAVVATVVLNIHERIGFFEESAGKITGTAALRLRAFLDRDVSPMLCSALEDNTFPPEFNATLYQELNQAVLGTNITSETLLQNHFAETGKSMGLISSDGQKLREVIARDILPRLQGTTLELGPFTRPIAVGPNVMYFDVLNKSGLLERAHEKAYPIVNAVEIDFVHPTGDLKEIQRQGGGNFSLVISSHVIEHQLDFVAHLTSVAELLVDNGYYLLFVPDKRYCFDHYLPVSTVAEILDDHFASVKATNHKLRSAIEARTFTTHNDAAAHWVGNHGPPRRFSNLRSAIEEYTVSAERGKYLDVHHYQFTPQAIVEVIDILQDLHLICFKLHRCYDTAKPQLEFSIILKKCKC